MKSESRSAWSLLFSAVLSLSGLAMCGSVDPHKLTAAGVITTVAGNGTVGDGGDGGPAISAQLDGPMGVAFDAAGNLYIADYYKNRIRKVTPEGTIRTVAGNGTRGFSGDGGPATSAQLSSPEGLAFDAAGNLYVAEFSNQVIRKITADGTIGTVAGNGTEGFSGDNGPATSAQLFGPSDVTLDATGNLYVADSYNHRVRKVTPAGVIATLAGTGTPGFGGDGGPAASAQLNYPWSVALDATGNLYIADSNNHRIRKVTPAGMISTVAGTGIAGFSGDGGPAASAQLNYSNGVLLDAAGNLYIVEHTHRIRRVSPAGVISTIAGNGTQGFSGDGGPATSAQLNHPNGAALDAAGNLCIADTDNHRVRRVQGTGSNSATFFAQVAVGGGYTTIFTLGNSGSGTASGDLTLTDQQGNPMTVNGVADNPGGAPVNSVGSSFPIQIPAGGVSFITVTPVSADDSTRAGWARLDSAGGSIFGVATFQYVASGILQSTAGVLQSQPTQYATIPVDYDVNRGRLVGYAVANANGESIEVKLAVVDQLGNVADDNVVIRLGAHQQIARFLHQDLASAQFKGSMVLRGQNGKSFVIVALVLNQDRLTVVPVQASKAPNLPN